MKVKIDIDTRTFIRLLFVVAGFIAVGFLLWRMLTALVIILVAFLLAIALSQPVSALARRLPGHSRVGATLIAYLAVLIIIAGFIYIAVPPMVDQTAKFVAAIPGYIQDVGQKRGLIGDFVRTYGLQDQLNSAVASVQAQSINIASGIGSSVVGGIATILGGFVTLIAVLVLSFLMLVEGPRWLERLWSLYANPARLVRHQRLLSKMQRVVSSYVSGQVLVASIAGLTALMVLLILSSVFQVPAAAVIPLAGLAFLTDLVPVIGATIGAAIIMVVLLLSDWGAALSFLVYFVVYQQIETNFIQPLVQSRTVALSALSILVAVILGIGLFGIIGGIVAIPIAGCIRVLTLDYLEHRQPTKTKRSLFRLVKADNKTV